MNRYVAFLRVINVAGHASVRMSDLCEAFAAAGCTGVKSCIQSGNVLFESSETGTPALFGRIRARLRDLLGDEPVVLFRTVREVERIVGGDPFKGVEAGPGVKLYVALLSESPGRKPRFPLVSRPEALEVVALKNLEVFIVSRRNKNGFFGFPNTFIEKELGVTATSRNWSTLNRIVELARRR